jgi:hypothetical protein
LRPRPSERYGGDISRVFREHDAKGDHQVLWICASDAIRKQLKSAPSDSWALLDYPDCCVQSARRSNAIVGEALARAIVDKAGGDPKLVRKALREDWKVSVEVPEKLTMLASARSVQRTNSAFPFALHTACDSCLDDPSSPTAELNQRYAAFAQQLDPALYAELLLAAAAISPDTSRSLKDRDP